MHPGNDRSHFMLGFVQELGGNYVKAMFHYFLCLYLEWPSREITLRSIFRLFRSCDKENESLQKQNDHGAELLGLCFLSILKKCITKDFDALSPLLSSFKSYALLIAYRREDKLDILVNSKVRFS